MQLQNVFRDPPSLRALDGSETILAGIRELSPEIKARSAEIEAARRIPPDLVDRLKSLGLFRMFVPRGHGGLELDLPAALAVISSLARIDGSVGWTAMIACGTALFSAWAQRETYDLSERAGRAGLRILAARRNGRARGGRLANQRPLAVCQRLHACRVDRRILRRHREWSSGP